MIDDLIFESRRRQEDLIEAQGQRVLSVCYTSRNTKKSMPTGRGTYQNKGETNLQQKQRLLRLKKNSV